MSKSGRNIYFICVTVLCWIYLNLYHASFALETETHKAINRYITQQSINDFSLNNYLKNQLGMKEGTETYFKSGYLDQPILKWIGYGGKAEDIDLRPFNHFLNPLTDKGILAYYSALQWAMLPVGNQEWRPISSWNDVRDYYFKALTSTDTATRENWFALTFQGVGQIMHLVQDMSVPAHVRDDKHLKLFGLGGDGYENWMDEEDNRNAIANYVPVISFEYDILFPLNIKNLFDTDRYNGTNPDITTSSNIIGLSEYTNANFLNQRKRIHCLEV